MFKNVLQGIWKRNAFYCITSNGGEFGNFLWDRLSIFVVENLAN